jgi:UDP-N-acetylmuramate dehydrogenase
VSRCEISYGYPLKSFNSWNVGGRCKRCALPRNAGEASSALRELSAEGTIYILGGGSNVLIADGDIDASVIRTEGMRSLKAEKSGGSVIINVESGCSTKELLSYAIRNGLGGLEFLTGIPGTVGGALWGNAGAAGVGFSGVIDRIETLDIRGETRIWSAKELKWEYRSCPWNCSAVMVTRASLILESVSQQRIREEIKRFALLKKGQPLGKKTAGCVFKNPVNDSAGRLLDLAGCKGLRIGDAVISHSHANFIENIGDATALDIFKLAERCRERVYSHFGVRLDYEVHFLGNFPQD